VSWDNPKDKVVLGLEFLKKIEVWMLKIKHNLKSTQDRHKSYEDKNMIAIEFKVGEHVLLKVNPNKISLKLGICTKLATKLCGQFEILDKRGLVAYMLALPTSMNVHNVFHVSLLKKCVHDSNHLIDWNLIQVYPKGDFQVQLGTYWTKKSNRVIEMVKV
jgi:hypothetical protein